MRMSKNTGREDGSWKINECFGWLGCVGRLDKWGLEHRCGGVIRLPGQIISLCRSLSLSLSLSLSNGLVLLFFSLVWKLWGHPLDCLTAGACRTLLSGYPSVLLIFLFFFFPFPGLVFERRDREPEKAGGGGDLSMFPGGRGAGVPWTNLSEKMCVCVYRPMYVSILFLSLLLPLPPGIASPSPFKGAHTAHAPGGASLLPLPPRSLLPACLPSHLPGGISSAAGSPHDLQRFV